MATFGWSLALFVPILNWYALVHLPTMWYKHGLVVGASSDTSPSAFFTSVYGFVVVLATAALLAGGVLISNSLSDGEGQAARVADSTAPADATRSPRPEPTEYRLRLTATEAEAKAKAHFLSRNVGDATGTTLATILGTTCEALDFNENALACIVLCTVPEINIQFTYGVDDRTGRVESR
ncbi:MAG: hypothetical protein IIB18_04445 [Chloroflexi bacterium]|nr:hypothetical protein [Chloroflexota bacterium]